MRLRILALAVLAAFFSLTLGCEGSTSEIILDGFDQDKKVTDDSMLDDDADVSSDIEQDQPDTDIDEPDPDIKDPDADVKQPEPDIKDPDADVEDPDTDVEEPDIDSEEPDADVEEPDTDVEEPECEVDEDCEQEPLVCHEFICELGKCIEVPEENDTPCSDGDFCTSDDTCQYGECVSGPPVVCEDGDPCTVSRCVPTEGCIYDQIEGTHTCGQGECFREVPICIDGVRNECIPGEPKAEVCDGKDNDCDGDTDEDNPDGGAACDTGWKGVCKAGTTICTSGKLVCTRNVEPTEEICNGLDNNCDGRIDEWDERIGKECDTGLLGVCGIGMHFCVEHSLKCLRQYDSSPEKCNGLDDDCDGETDEDNPGGGGRCETGLLGACNNGTWTCTNGEIVCAETTQPLDRDHCDGQDHDCDGEINEEGSLGCRTYYEDKDGDGWGNSRSTRCLCGDVPPTGYTTRSADCCDTDSSVNRDVRDDQWFETKNNCGDFDYDCDGREVQELQEIGRCVQGGYGGSIICSLVVGWNEDIPKCGETGSYIHDCVNEQGRCKKYVTEKIQRCQ